MNCWNWRWEKGGVAVNHCYDKQLGEWGCDDIWLGWLNTQIEEKVYEVMCTARFPGNPDWWSSDLFVKMVVLNSDEIVSLISERLGLSITGEESSLTSMYVFAKWE